MVNLANNVPLTVVDTLIITLSRCWKSLGKSKSKLGSLGMGLGIAQCNLTYYEN